MIKQIYCSAALLVAFNFTYAATANVAAKKVSGYEAYSEGRQINVYRFVGDYGGNYFAYVGDKQTIERKCNVVNGKCKGEPTGRAALRAAINEGFCQRPNWSALTCYSGVGGGDDSRGDGSGTPDRRGNDGSKTPAGSGGGQASGSGGTNSNGGGGKSGSGGGSGNTSGSGGGSGATGGGSGSGGGTGSGGGSGSGSAGNGGGSAAGKPKHRKGDVFSYGLQGWSQSNINPYVYPLQSGYTTKYCNQTFNGISADDVSRILGLSVPNEHKGSKMTYSISCGYIGGGEKDIYDHTDPEDEECQSTKYVKQDTGSGSFSVLCTKKASPASEGGSSVDSLGGGNDGAGGQRSNGGGSQNGGGGGGRSGGGKPSNSGSQGGGDSGSSSDSSDASTGGSDNSGGSSEGGSGSSNGSDAGRSDSSDKGKGESKGEGRDYSAILESIFDKLTDVVDAVKDATNKILAKMGGGDANAQSEGHGAQSGGGTAANDGQDDGAGGKGSNQGSGKVKGKDAQGDGEGDGQEDKGKSDRKDEEDKNQDGQDGDVEKPANDFGGAPTVDVGGALSGGGWFSDSAAAVCPAPINADLGFIGTFEISYEWLCAVARILRPFLVAFAYLAALFIVVRKGE